MDKALFSKKALYGRRIYCERGKGIHYEQEEVALFEFADYSWGCNVCGGRHCSQCFYNTDGETITVTDCGRFD